MIFAKRSLLILILLVALYTLILGWPEKQHYGANFACHGIPIGETCLGVKTIWAYIDP